MSRAGEQTGAGPIYCRPVVKHLGTLAGMVVGAPGRVNPYTPIYIRARAHDIYIHTHLTNLIGCTPALIPVWALQTLTETQGGRKYAPALACTPAL